MNKLFTNKKAYSLFAYIFFCAFFYSFGSAPLKDPNFWKSQAKKSLEQKILTKANTTPEISIQSIKNTKDLITQQQQSGGINNSDLQNKINLAKSNTQNVNNSSGVVKQELTKLENLAENALNIVQQALEKAADAIKNIALDAFQGLKIISEMVGQAVIAGAKDIESFAQKAASEIADIAKAVLNEIENIASAVVGELENIGSVFSSVVSTIACWFGDCPSPTYYVNDVEVSESCYNTYNRYYADNQKLCTCQTYYSNIKPIFSSSSSSYQINIPYLQARLSRMPAVLEKIAQTITIENSSQQIQSSFNQQIQQNLPKGITLPASLDLSSISQIEEQIHQNSAANLAQITAQFDLAGKINFCNNFTSECMYNEYKLIFDNISRPYLAIRYDGEEGWLGPGYTVSNNPNAIEFGTTYTVPKYVLGNYNNIVVLCAYKLYPKLESINANLQANIQNIKNINIQIDQYIKMATQKEFINAHYSWIRGQASKISIILKNSQNGLNPAKEAFFQKYLNKINQQLDLITNSSNTALQIDAMYKIVKELFKDVSLIAVYIDININAIKQLVSSKDHNIVKFVNYSTASSKSGWKPDLNIALDIMNYINDNIFTDKMAQTDSEDEINAIIERSENLLQIVNNIISNQLTLACYLGNEKIVSALLSAGANPNFSLFLPPGIAYSQAAFSSYVSLYSQPYSIENLFDNSNGIQNANGMLLLENYNNGIYGYTPLTAAIAAPINNTITKQISRTQYTQSNNPSLYDILKTSAQYSQTQIGDINIQKGSFAPTQAPGNSAIVSKLLFSGADPNMACPCTMSNSNALNAFLNSLKNNNIIKETNILTPLQLSVPLGNTDILEQLIIYGAKLEDIGGIKGIINIINPNISQPNYINLIKCLIQLGAENIVESLKDLLDKNFIDKNFKEIEIGQNLTLKDIIYEAINQLIIAGANPNGIKDPDGNQVPVIYNIVSSAAEKNINVQDAYQLIELLLKHGANCNLQDKVSGKTALIASCQSGFGQDVGGLKTNIVNLLITNGALSNIKDTRGKTALNYTLEHGFLYIIQYLIQANATINNEAQHLLNTYLISLCNGNNNPTLTTPENFPSIFNILTNNTNTTTKTTIAGAINPRRDIILSSFANTNATDINGNTALIYLVQNIKLSTDIKENAVNALLQKGANPLALNKTGKSALDYAPVGSSIYSQIKFNQNLANKLLTAVNNNNLSTVQELVEQNACVNCYDKNGSTPLIIAIKNNNLDMVKYLVSQGANLNVIDSSNKAPLIYAIQTDNISIVQYIVQKYPFNITDQVLQTTTNQQILDLLNEVNKNINTAKTQKSPSLTMALSLYATEENYSEYTSASTVNYTALFNAIQANNLTLVQSLINPISDSTTRQNYLNHQDSNGNTALIWAIQNTNNLALIQYIIANSPNIISINDKNNDSPLMIALSKGATYASIVDYLYAQNSEQLTSLSQSTYNGSSSNPITGTADNTSNNNILLYAIENNFTNLANKILSNKQLSNLITQTNNNGDTCATIAAQKGNLSILKTILTLQPSLLAQANNQTFTALSYAVYNNNPDMIEYLLPLYTSNNIPVGQIETACFLLAIYNADQNFFNNSFLCSVANSSVSIPTLPNNPALNIWNTGYNGTTLGNNFYLNLTTQSSFAMSYNLYNSLPNAIQNVICYSNHAPSVDNNNNPISITCPNPPSICSN